MVQVVREAGIEVAGEDDRDILEPQGGIRRWIAVPVEDEDEATNCPALSEIRRKISVSSAKSASTPKDDLTMGQQMENYDFDA
jgi:platelet-activating factor acetylhydrolase